jgi:hypothetical protein
MQEINQVERISLKERLADFNFDLNKQIANNYFESAKVAEEYF